MNIAVQSQQSIRFRGRSFLAFALTPEPPVADWLTELDKWTRNSPGFFTGKAVILDLGAVKLSESAILHLINQLAERAIRIMGLEGVDPSGVGPQLPPVLSGGRAGGEGRPLGGEDRPLGSEERPLDSKQPDSKSSGSADLPAAPSAAPPHPQEPATLLIESPIRSGQSVVFPHGEVTVLGSVASGAEIVAGGSIHVYGTLRGRAMAGSMGDSRARIFCSRNEAELLAIDGYYQTAEKMDASLRGRPVQVWLEGAELNITNLD
ncbi:MAG TPA: septum site-determining protein MinC [Xanthobacteraceae bacterium]